MNAATLIDDYLAGPGMVRAAVDGLSAAELDALPVPGTWSIRQVVCHLADAEILYADRMKRILAEEQPPLVKADPEQFQSALGGSHRKLSDELAVIESVRLHMAAILRAATAEQFARQGIHSTDGPLTLRAVLERAVAHIPHHVKFIQAKRDVLAGKAG